MRIQEHYAKYVTSGGDGLSVLENRATELGYEKDTLVPTALYKAILFRAFCGSGCPLLIPGGMPTSNDKFVIDLGCGAGHDVLLAASYLKGDDAKAIGVDVTPEMVVAARENVNQYPELQKRIELIQDDFGDPNAAFICRFENQVDLIISNGVFNLCKDKAQVFRNAFRLLRPGGRLVFSDVMKLDGNEINVNAIIATSINGDVFSS